MTFVSNVLNMFLLYPLTALLRSFFALIGFELKDFLYKNLEQSPVYPQRTNAKTSL